MAGDKRKKHWVEGWGTAGHIFIQHLMYIRLPRDTDHPHVTETCHRTSVWLLVVVGFLFVFYANPSQPLGYLMHVLISRCFQTLGPMSCPVIDVVISL